MTLDHHGTIIFFFIHAFLIIPASTFPSAYRSLSRDAVLTSGIAHHSDVHKKSWGQLLKRNLQCCTTGGTVRGFPTIKMSASSSPASNNVDTTTSSSSLMYQSYIETIKCENFMYNAAVVLEEESSPNQKKHEVVIHLGDEGPNLVAVTGETGSGKSLLVFKVFQLVLGEKVSSSILRGSTYASGEVVIKLSEPHLSHIQEIMKVIGLNPAEIISVENGFATLSLKRTIIQSENQNKNKANSRFRSKCEINGNQVTLKALRLIVKPLITTVDAAAASSALSQGKARVAIIDTGVSNILLSRTKASMKAYRKARKKRQEIEREIENRIMPASFTSADSEENIELLKHWIDELNEFESRILTFQDSIVSSRVAASLLKNTEYDESVDDDSESSSYGSSFVDTLQKFADCSWEHDKTSGQDSASIASSFYSNLLDLREGVKNLDSKLASAHASCDALSSLSSPQSVAYALEECRRHLFDATTGYESNGALNEAAETSHELLNKLEDALSSCASFMSDDSNGLISTLERMRGSVLISVEEIDFLIADWGSMARKHGVSPFSLPPLHHSLRQELDGNVEARSLLPKAKEKERVALDDFQAACYDLSEARGEICSSLTKSVTSRLKDLGMEGSTFTAKLNSNVVKCTDSSAYSDSNSLGVDSVDFLLTHRSLGEHTAGESQKNSGQVNLDVIGSSGEKARLLLAIETDLPGSIGASCNSVKGNNSNEMEEITYSGIQTPVPPVCVVYDEIDAHVGGRAAVSLAKLLADQTQMRNYESNGSTDERRSQIISITHSPSVAAIADRHVVIQKLISNMDKKQDKDSVLVNSVRGLSRLEEISRMASGDLAVKESIKFAEALLRDGIKYKSSRSS